MSWVEWRSSALCCHFEKFILYQIWHKLSIVGAKNVCVSSYACHHHNLGPTSTQRSPAVPRPFHNSTTHIKCPKLTDLRNFRNIQFYTEMPTTKIKIKMSVILFRKILYCIYTEGINEITQKTRDGMAQTRFSNVLFVISHFQLRHHIFISCPDKFRFN